MEFPARYKDDASASTGLTFIRVYNKWHTQLKSELRDLGITLPQFLVMTALGYLSQSDDFVTQVKIAKIADMDVMTVSQIVRGLDEKGYLKRFPNPKDTRANAVQLLPKGEEMIMQAFPRVVNIDDVFFGVLGEKESIFQDLLHQMLK